MLSFPQHSLGKFATVEYFCYQYNLKSNEKSAYGGEFICVEAMRFFSICQWALADGNGYRTHV